MSTSHRDFAKREIRFELSAFGGQRVVIFGGGGGGGSLPSGFANTCDILSLVSEVGL